MNQCFIKVENQELGVARLLEFEVNLLSLSDLGKRADLLYDVDRVEDRHTNPSVG